MVAGGRSVPDLAAGAPGSTGLPSGGWCVAAAGDEGGGMAESRPTCGPWSLDCGRRSGGCNMSAAGQIRTDSTLVLSMTAQKTLGETLDLLRIERWRCLSIVAPLWGIDFEFAPVEGTNDADGTCLVAQVSMKIASTTVMADDGGVFDVLALSRHRR
ncbi:uncharacterized protein LOC123398352 [Hordeum vulgare subsp. vulgare]|uniref:uncharacterized protein LOC123398352 n=1 Tax=Hordeum vulgare subsp. vulgare TaxID=112509 RepID=UPI001D1A521A|nr:uncharacterized protein LOC123398352 [Hordeum vulgare subsp. vulgare]